MRPGVGLKEVRKELEESLIKYKWFHLIELLLKEHEISSKCFLASHLGDVPEELEDEWTDAYYATVNYINIWEEPKVEEGS